MAVAEQIWALSDSGIEIGDDIVSQISLGVGCGEGGRGSSDAQLQSTVCSALIRRLHQHLRADADDVAKRSAKHNMAVLKTLMSKLSDWDPGSDLPLRQARVHHDLWQRLGELVLAPDLARYVGVTRVQ